MRRLLLLAVLWLSACSSTPPRPAADDPNAAWRTRSEVLRAVDHWTAVGRIAVRTEEEAWNASLRWEQRGESYRIRITAPMGQGAMQLSGEPGRVVLVTSENERFSARDPETLIFDHLGWRMPVSGLRFWIQGLADPATSTGQLILRDDGYPRRLVQSGWTVRYLRFGEEQPAAFPNKVFLDRGELSVRIVVNRWDLTPS